MERKADQPIKNLKRFFDIRGDGVAHFRLEDAAREKRFLDVLRKMRGLKLHEPSQTRDAKQ